MSNILTLFYIAFLLNIPTIGLCLLLSFMQKCEDNGDNGEIKDPDPSLADENEEGGGEVEIETPTEAGENNN